MHYISSHVGPIVVIVIVIVLVLATLRAFTPRIPETPLEVHAATTIPTDDDRALLLTFETAEPIAGEHVTRIIRHAFIVRAPLGLELGRALSIECAMLHGPKGMRGDHESARTITGIDPRESIGRTLELAVTCRACGVRWSWKEGGTRPARCAACDADVLATDAELAALREDPRWVDRPAKTCHEKLQEEAIAQHPTAAQWAACAANARVQKQERRALVRETGAHDGRLERRDGLCDYCDERARFEVKIGELGICLVCQTHVNIGDVSDLAGPFATRTITEIRDTV